MSAAASTFRICTKCRHPFPVLDSPKSRMCMPCWKRGQGYDLTKADRHFDAIHAYYDNRMTQLEQRLRALEAKAPPVQAEQLSPTRISKLIKLCHPDRHNNSLLSNEATKWLLSLRKAS